MIEQQLEQDIKTALLAGDKTRVMTLRMLKSVLLSAKVAAGTRDIAMADAEVTVLFAKEAKKRQESADMYTRGGSPDRAEAELGEKAIIETYLPTQMSESELTAIIDDVIAATGADGPSAMGLVIGQVKSRVAGSADGATIARIVKEKLSA